jgi:Holliday junction DNA helicase RuvA
LSGIIEKELVGAIVNGEVKRLSSVPGIGKRTAERIILDLRPKFEKVYPLNEAISDASPVLEDLKSALLNLNYPTV